MKDLLAKTVDLRSGDAEEKRAEIRDYFLKTWDLNELLYKHLKTDEVFYKRADSLRHIILFYFGHTSVFFINKFFLAKIIDKRINPTLESVFAIGVDEMSWDDLDNNHYEWPSVEEVRNYRDEAKKVILDVIDNAPLEMPIDWNSPFWIIMMGIEHKRIHVETSSVLIRQLPLKDLVPGVFGDRCPTTGDAPENEVLPVTGAKMSLGKPMDYPLYGWDNEYGKYDEEVADFGAAKYLTSNGEFLEFVNDKGYETEEYWTEEGWNWRNYRKAEMPLFWLKSGDDYRLRLVAEEIAMPWNWPVEVNYLEAKAFCNWKSAKTGKSFRLPTEAEWYRLHNVANLVEVTEWDEAPGNINLEHFASPSPVNMFEQGNFFDVIGNVWQWTETPITGFPGFKVHPMYDDFATPTFDGKHNLIKGGSWISTGNEATIHSRYAFRRHFYQHAGFRYIESDAPLNIQQADYETDEETSVLIEENWGDDFSSNVVTSVQLAKLVNSVLKDKSDARILDLNAGHGRLAYELARDYQDITAIDFTAHNIKIPIQLQEQGYIRYTKKDEGDLQFFRDVVLDDFDLTEVKDRILFMQADAMNLRPNFKDYDLVIVPYLLEHLSNPTQFLSTIHSRINENGYLVIASDYDWNPEISDSENWPGGFKQDGEPVTSLDGISQVLDPHFTLYSDPIDVDRFIKRSSRITEKRVLEVSVWKKK